jgi:hypothetical protein
MKYRSAEHDLIRFGVKLIAELGFDYKTLCIGNREKACGFLVIF